MNKEIILFKDDLGNDVSFEDLLKKIYENSVKKQEQLIATAEHLKPMITTLQEAVIIMPTLVNLQKVSVENDDNLIKMAAIIHRGLAKNKSKINPDNFGITMEERKQLMIRAREIRDSVPGESSVEEIKFEQIEE